MTAHAAVELERPTMPLPAAPLSEAITDGFMPDSSAAMGRTPRRACCFPSGNLMIAPGNDSAGKGSAYVLRWKLTLPSGRRRVP